MNNVFHPFDAIAHRYDAEFTNSVIGRIQRTMVRHKVKSLLGSLENKKVLEINCGSGEDALWLNSLGASVHATDISEKMIEVSRAKVNNEKIEFHCMSFSDLAEKLKGKKYDFIFSNFGGLNCISPEEIESLSDDLNGLLEENGKICIVIMGRKCMWEELYYTLKGRTGMAYRRRSYEPVPVKLGCFRLNTWYYSPTELKALLGYYFKPVHTSPVGVFIPPSYLQTFFKTKKVLLNVLLALEKMVDNMEFLCNRADHYLMVFEKR